MKITLLHPSRGRAIKAIKTLEYWIENSSKTIEIEHILSIDNDEEQQLEYSYIEGFFPCSKMIINNNTSVVEATNHAAKIATGDVLIYLSDDFKCPKNWDLLIKEKFSIQENELVETPLLIKVDDCLQKFEVAVLTIPIMNRALYLKLGYFWNPEYKSMFVDEHLYWITFNNKFMMLCQDLKFPHEHPCNGLAENDETYKRSALNWEQGKAVFAKHKSLNFPL